MVMIDSRILGILIRKEVHFMDQHTAELCLISLKILYCLLKYLHLILGMTKERVAAVTQKPSHFPGHVIVIYVKPAPPAVWRASADFTDATLRSFHLTILLNR
jgi:hypothetical protein